MHAKRRPRFIAKLLVLAYQNFLSPNMLHACRFTPACSAYALEALETHGIIRGGWLVIKRLLRCRPFGRSGYDPVGAA